MGAAPASLESTARDTSVTELTAVSGLVGPTPVRRVPPVQPRARPLLFAPARWCGRPGPGLATLFSGGYRSPPAPATPDRLPRPYLPGGLGLTGTEGAGRGADAGARPGRGTSCGPGDRVWAAPRQGRRGRPNASASTTCWTRTNQLTTVPHVPRRGPSASAEVLIAGLQPNGLYQSPLLTLCPNQGGAAARLYCCDYWITES